MKRRITAVLAGATILLGGARLAAQAPAVGFRAEFSNIMKEIEGKYTQLATATPWEKFAWRPGKGVRSVCEVFLHISGENYFLAESLGPKTPKDVDLKTIETCPASKEKVIATMKTSFAHMRSAVNATPDKDSDLMVDFFGEKLTKRALLLAIAEHAGEHLGQEIAYARMNGIVPPWSK